MADIQMKVEWRFITNPEEAALILTALGGRLREEDKEVAKVLSDKLTLSRAKNAREYAEQMAIHASKIIS